MFTVEQLTQISQNLDPVGNDLAGDVAALVPAMVAGGITSKNQVCAFLANVAQETDRLNTLEEYGDEDYFRSFLGDEWPYHGRGYIMNTWLSAYQRLSDLFGVDLVGNPDLLAQNKDLAARAAVWYWNNVGCGPPADNQNFKAVCGLINRGELYPTGPINGFDERLAAYERAKAVIGTGTDSLAKPEEEASKMVTGQDIANSARKLLGVFYEWWQEGEPIPLWGNDYPNAVPPRSWFDANGTMCSDLVNFARMDNGLPPIGGTPAYYDWVKGTAGAADFDSTTPGIPGAICVNPGTWRGGEGQGHIAIYTDEHTLIQATDGQGAFAGVNEQEQDYDSHSWANYWLYALMPDVDYRDVLPDAPKPQTGIVRPRWVAIDRDGWHRSDGSDWSRGWYPIDAAGSQGQWKGPGEA